MNPITAAVIAWLTSPIWLGVPAWLWVRHEDRVADRASSFDRHAEEAVRLVRPASSQWMGWE